MKKRLVKISIFCLAFFFMESCSKDDKLNADLSTFNVDTFEKGPLDEWLETEFLDPYNIEVVYRWDRYLSPLAKDIVPPYEDRVRPAMEAVRDVWLRPYHDIAGAEFIKTLCPKQIVLFGSAEYNTNGTITLGTADAGRRVVLNVINTFDKANGTGVKRMMRTVHHEFTHTINQMVDIPTEYQTISRGGYFSNWTTQSLEIAKSLGFVSQYARMNPLEDFAEMTSHLLIEGQFWFNQYVASCPADAQVKLRQKEQAVVDYFNINFGIDFRALQNRVLAALDEVTPPLPFASVLRNNGIGTIAVTYNQLSASNRTLISNAQAAVAAIPDYGLTLDNSFNIVFVNPSDYRQIQMQYTMRQGTTAFLAFFDYDLIVSDDGSTQFVAVPNRGTVGAYSNAGIIRPALVPWLNYLTGNTFMADWVTDLVPGSRGIYGGFFLADNRTSYFYGNLQ